MFRLVILLLLLASGITGSAQTVVNVDLTASPNITKTLTGYPRSGNNCGGSDCIIFNVTVNPGSDLVSFSASQITGASFYTIDCGASTPIGTPACISGKTQFSISFCKPGGNTNVVYTLSASTAVRANDDLTVREGCPADLSVTGLDPASTSWTSIFPGAPGAYNSFLSCTTGCATTTFTAGASSPAYIDYKVTGITSACPNSKSDIVRVYVTPPMSVDFDAGSTVICSGGAATLSVNATGGNAPYRYTWTKDGSPLANTSSSINATDVGTYTVVVTDNTNCLPVSQSVTVTAAATPVAPAVNGTTICSGTSTSLTATAPGGTYQWFSAPSGGTAFFTGATYTTPVLTNTAIYYVQTILSGCTSARSAVTVTVNAIPAAPSASGTTICSGNTALLTATAPGGSYEWYDAASGGNLLASGANYTTSILNATATYYVQTSVNGCTSPRTAVSATVTPTPTAPTAADVTICSGSQANLSATAPGGNYEWFDVPSGGTAIISGSTFTTPGLTAGKTYYVQTTVNGCTSPRTAVIVNVNAIPEAPAVNGTAICSGTFASLTATAPGGTYQWFSAPSGGTAFFTGATYTTPVLTNTAIYYVQTILNGCTSARSAVTVTVNAIPAAPSAMGTTICSGNTALLTATAPGGNYEWYDAASGGNLLASGANYTTSILNATATYYVQTSVNGCSSPRTAVTATVIPSPTAPAAADVTICSGSQANLSATAPGGNYEWFDVPTGGTAIASGSTFTTKGLTSSTTFYVQTTINGCTSPRTVVTVNINPLPAAPVASDVTICEGNQTILTATGPGGTYRWFDALSGGNLLYTGASYSTPVLTATTTYFIESESVLGCTGPRTTVTASVIPAANPAFFYPSGTFCRTGPDPTPTLAGPAGTFSSTAGLIIDPSTGEIDVSGSSLGTYIITFSTSTTCIYSSSINVTITDSPNANFSFPVFCQGQSAQALPIFTTGASAGQFSSPDPGLVFLSSSTGEINLRASTPGTYIVTNTIAASGGCAATAASSTVVIKPTPEVTSAAAAASCSGDAQTYAITSSLGGTTTFTWSRAAVTGISNPAITGQTSSTITEALMNTTTGPINVVYLIIPSADGCDGPTFTYKVTVNPEPRVTTASAGSICNNTAQNYSIMGNFTGIQFAWSRAAVPGISNTAVSGQTTTITEALVNTTTSPIHVTYSIVPSAGGCSGTEFIYTLTVNPTPIVNSATSAVLCSGLQQNYDITSNLAGATFTWSRNAVAGISNPAVTNQNTSVINETLLNTSPSPIDVVYSILPSANGCDGPSFNYTVTVNPIPLVTSAATATNCDNTVQNYTITSSVAGTTFTWNRVSVIGISNPPAIGQTSSSITEALVNTTSAPIDVSYQITPAVNGCTGPAFTYTITVYPAPTVSSAAAGSVCNGAVQNYTITGRVPGTTFIWSRAAVTGLSNAAVGQQSGNSITETLVNTTTSPIEVAYVIVPWANGCSGQAFIYTLTVNPTPVVTSPSTASLCSNVAQDYTLTSSTSGTTFTWSRADVPGISNPAVTGQTSSNIAEALINTTSAPVDVLYQIIPFANGCSGPVFSYVLNVKPTPVVNSGASATICSNTAQYYSINASIAGTSFRWSRAAVTGILNPGVSTQTSEVIDETLINSTNSPIDVVYQIIPTLNGCDGPAFNYTVSVSPIPIITSTASGTICNATMQHYEIISTVTGTTFTWSRPVTAGISNAGVSGQASNIINEALENTTLAPIDVLYTIVATANGCSGAPFTYTLTVNPSPITVGAATATTCSGVAQDYSITGNITGTSFTWSRAAVAGISNTALTNQRSNAITEPLFNTSPTPIDVAYVIVPSANGCEGTPFIYTVTVHPSTKITSAATATICSGTAQNYAITSSVSGATFTWGRAAVAGISNIAVTDETANTITETLFNTTSAPIDVAYVIIPSANGCQDEPFTYTLTVNPTITVTSAAAAATCSGTPQTYAITGNVPGTTFTWIRVAVSGISNASVNGRTTSVIDEALLNTTSAPIDVNYVILPSANGCQGPAFTYTLTINPIPMVNSAALATVCSGAAQEYAITGTVSGTTFTWSRAAKSGIANTAVGGQTGNTIIEALVNNTLAPIDVVYQIIPALNGCEGPPFTYTLRVNPVPVVTSAERADICSNARQNYVLAANLAGTTFTWSRNAVAGISNAPVNGQTTSTIDEALMNSTSAPIDVSYLVVPSANGCQGQAFTYIITVNPTSRITNSNLNQTICSSATTTAFIPESNVLGTTFKWTATATGGITGYVSSGSGTIPAQTIGSSAGGGTITYQIVPSFAGCTGITGNHTITVLNQVPLMPSVSNSSPLCIGQSLSLSAESVTGASYKWSGPEGFSSSEQNPVIHNASPANEGLYTVILTVGPCSATANTTVVVNRPAFVSVMDGQTVCADNAMVQLSGNVSGGSNSGNWTSSGTGNFTAGSSALNGTYLPSEADKANGKVTLTLTATNTASCQPAAKSVNINIIPAAIADAGADQTICAYEPVVLRGKSTGTQLRWTSSGSGTFMPGSSSLTTQYLPSNTDKAAGKVTITLTASGSGCTPVSDQINVAIVQPPTLKLEQQIYAYSGESITLSPEVSGDNLQYLWMPNRGLNNNTLKNPVFTGTENIRYTLTITGTAGCKVSGEILVKILAPVKIPNAFSPNGDGVNDTWKASGLETYPGVVISVYNRFGVQVYSGLGTSAPWDGTFKGNPLPVGVYYYVLRFVKYSNPLTGSLTIIR